MGGDQIAGLFQPADLKLNLKSIDLQDCSVDLILSNHVLEHVDYAKASKELSRILRSNGVLLCMVPIIESWLTTHENSDIATDEKRILHFGQEDHVRLYGRDLRDRITKGGFSLRKEITAQGEDMIRYCLVTGENVFILHKA